MNILKKTVKMFTNFKYTATAAERLSELQILAELHPERFDRMIVVYLEENKGSEQRVRFITSGGNGKPLFEAVGMLEYAKTKILAGEW
jgi:hypothetical protein